MSVRILQGDVREVLRTLPDESVHCVVTSPPYWGLRDYGTAQWAGGEAGCDHAPDKRGSRFATPVSSKQASNTGSGTASRRDCSCGARRIDSQLGIEPSLDEYIAGMVGVFREVKRVLRRDGTAWINMGDSYASGEIGRHDQKAGYYLTRQAAADAKKGNGERQQARLSTGLKPKDLCGVPWRIAFALQADGWWLRSDIIWAKPNPMPESVTDRPTKAHEYLFLLAKSERYFYDAEAIREPVQEWNTPIGKENAAGIESKRAVDRDNAGKLAGGHGWKVAYCNPMGRNRRTVWEIATAPFPEAHFATFPPALVEPCIKSGTSDRGCCGKCGAPWIRKTEVEQVKLTGSTGATHHPNAQNWAGITARTRKEVTTLGWSPSCSCDAAVQPCTVLDPFGGAGTTGLVADRLGRNAILIELNPAYAAMARKRLTDDCPLFMEAAE